MYINSLDTHSTQDLARACAEKQARRRRASSRESDPCYELFRRAFAPSPDQQAWQAILEQYERLVQHWLFPCATTQEALKDTTQDTFIRFWQGIKNKKPPFDARFSNTQDVMGYLKKCAITTRIRAAREADRRRKLQKRLMDSFQVDTLLSRTGRDEEDAQRLADLKAQILPRLKDERERVVFELSYHDGLPPREIYEQRPELFADAKEVSRIKENLLKRLRRDKSLREWWDDGGNPPINGLI
jgi:RNA polymerase sigma factor (sigma-70 family)